MIRNLTLRAIIILVCFFITGCKENTEVSLSGEEAVSVSDQKETIEEEVVKTAESNKVVVYVNGAVKRPGVYTLKQGDRIYQAVDMAGGMTSKAQKDALNLAETVIDAQNIYIMTKKEYQNRKAENSNVHDEQESSAITDLVNINSADAEGLTKLPGIGQSKAAAIIAYREENGSFSSKEDIKKVSGIGDATYANIEDLITIK